MATHHASRITHNDVDPLSAHTPSEAAGDWYGMEAGAVVDRLGSDAERGLSGNEAARRMREYGPNELVERGRKSPWLIVWEQVAAIMVVILIIAAVVSALLGDFTDAGAILIIVVLNVVLGFTQEYRAERAMAALKQLAVPTVKVRRDGAVHEVSSRELVPGDIVLLEAGSLVPGDCRLLEAASLRVQEAVLTGESEPVDKVTHSLAGGDLPLGDRRNMAFMGTAVIHGRGRGVLTATGMSTELGRIAVLLQSVKHEQSPLQRRLDGLGKRLALIAFAIVVVVFALGLLRGEDPELMFLTAVSLAVAAVPEGLPAVVTIALALGAQRMLKHRALIRKLPAVETLGSVTVICSDKTGTLTENRMTVAVLDVEGDRLDLTERLHDDAPILSIRERREPPPHIEPAQGLLLAGGALCNDAALEITGEGPDCLHAVGDPTEGALVVAAARFGLWKDLLDEALMRVGEAPFDSGRKRMTTVHRLPDTASDIPKALEPLYGSGSGIPGMGEATYIAFTKGAVDGLLDVSGGVWARDQVAPMSPELREGVLRANDRLAADGMRVLGVAFVVPDHLPAEDDMAGRIERDLVFVGLVGMVDPARPEVKDAVQTCKQAGIRPVMITGDHPLTAQYIAGKLGIDGDGSGEQVLTGQDLDRLAVEELERVVESVPVYARVSPEHKLNIVQALQNRGHIVAMTGDGVNDAPALKRADIGVAMGITGTDVSKEAADMVLLDDNFATIVAAVREGRVIYDNIRKFIKYLMTTNSAEIWVMLVAPFIGMPLPLLPLQILWINLVTDGLPALALGVEPAEKDVMRRPPYRPGESIFSRGAGAHMLWVGLLMGLVALGTGYWYWLDGKANWQTMLFTVLALSQMAQVMGIRSGRASLFQIGLLSNRPLLGAVGLTLALQLLVIYIPVLQNVFGTTPLSWPDLAVALLLSSVVFWVVELEKLVLRTREQKIEDRFLALKGDK